MGSVKLQESKGNDLHGVAPSLYLPQIDALRAIAALAVVFFHLYTGVYLKAEFRPLMMLADLRSHVGFWRWVAAPSLFGYAGVPLFFVISGFCIHHSFLNSRRSFSYLPFMGRRFWRIYPAYLLAICLSLFLPGNPIWKTHHLRKSLAMHLLFVHNFNQTTIFELSAPFWTLAFEFQFYAAYPILLKLRKKWGMDRATAFSFALCVCVSFGFHQRLLGHLQLPWLPVMYWVQWCLGALIAERFFDGRKPLFRLPLALLFWIAGILFAVPVSIFGEWNYLAWAILCAAIIERWVRRSIRTPAVGAFVLLVWLGTISYSIYLLHAIVLVQVLPRLPGSAETRFALSLVVILPTVIAASAASYYLIERPGIAIGRRCIARCFGFSERPHHS